VLGHLAISEAGVHVLVLVLYTIAGALIARPVLVRRLIK